MKSSRWLVICFFVIVCVAACDRPLVCRAGETIVQGRCASGEVVKEKAAFEPPVSEMSTEPSQEVPLERQEVLGDTLDGGASEEPILETTIEQKPQVCVSGSLRCRDTKTVEACNASGTAWEQQSCPQDQLCEMGRCVVERCTEGNERPCYTGTPGTAGIGLCKEGTQRCVGAVWAACVGEVVPKTEVCDNKADDDCDAKVDEGCVPPQGLEGRWRRRGETMAPYRFQIMFLANGTYEMIFEQQKIADGTYTLQGDTIEILDTPGTNCTKSHPTRPKGQYKILLNGNMLTFSAVSDLCFSREGYLTFEPWVKIP